MSTFAQLAILAEQMSTTASRLTKRAEIAAAITTVHTAGDGDEGLFAQYLAGLPFPEHDNRKLNAGGALLTRAVLAVSGATQDELTQAYRRHGDLGAATHDLFRDHGHTGLSPEGSSSLHQIEGAFAGMATARTTAIRAATVEALLRRATPLEAKYLLKLMLGDMRTGVGQPIVEEAIAVASANDVAAVRHAVMLEADLAHATARAFAGTLAEARMTLFHPLGFMLASPVETPEEAIERFTPKPPKPKPAPKPRPAARPRRPKKSAPEPSGLDPAMLEAMANDIESTLNDDPAPPRQEVQAYLEDKYDGMRAQLHCGDPAEPGRVALYSRNREDITESFPELVEAFAHAPEPLILDGEILGWNYTTAQALPFAIMGQRIGRKRVDNELRERIPVVFMAFDLLFADRELQLARPLRQRRDRLEAVAETLTPLAVSPLILSPNQPQSTLFADTAEPTRLPVPRLLLSPAKLVESAEEIDRAYADARARANEGVMLKSAVSHYQPGRRGLAWVKLKRTLETLDVVITGAEYGSGRKSQFLSDYTFAVQSPSGELLNVGKAYSGVTDAEIAELTEFLKLHTLEDHGHFRTVEPLVILEVAFNNIMRSDRHASGYALRFPRILRLRPDKPLAEIDTVARVEEIYQSQVDKPAELED